MDVFHDVWRRAATYDAEGGTVVGWIMNQARSRAIDRLRFEQRKKRTRPADERTVPPAVMEPAVALGLREQRDVLTGALAVLTADERRAIETAFFAGLTYAEVATRLDEPVGTVKTRIRSGLGKLKRALAGRGHGR